MQRQRYTSEAKEENISINQQLLRNMLLTMPSPLSKPTSCLKRTARGQQICHGSILLMRIEVIMFMSIAMTELEGDVYFLLCTVLHTWFIMVWVIYDTLRVLLAYFLCWRYLSLWRAMIFPLNISSQWEPKTGKCLGGTKARHLPWVKCQPLTSFEATTHAGSQLKVPVFGERPHSLATKNNLWIDDQRLDRLR